MTNNIQKQLAILLVQIQHIRTDLQALRDDADGNRDAWRDAVVEMRGDFALLADRQNAEIGSIKKKSTA